MLMACIAVFSCGLYGDLREGKVGAISKVSINFFCVLRNILLVNYWSFKREKNVENNFCREVLF